MKIATILISTMLYVLPIGGLMPYPSKDRSFLPIEQPWPVRIGVVIGGLTLIGTELWWFLGRKP
jgi:plastocyanin domain-containing protein